MVLYRRVDWSPKLQGGPQDKVRVPDELSAKEENVCFAFPQVIIGLLAVNDEPDGGDFDFWNGLLGAIGKGNL